MRIGHLGLGLGSALFLSLLSAGSASAQRVSADIRIGGRGPVSGHVRIGDRRDFRWDRGWRGRQVRVERFGRRDRAWHQGWFRQFQRQARVVVVYYDRRDDCYYDRFHRGLQEIRVYERDGRYYQLDDDRYDRRDDRRDGRHDGRDRWDDRDDRDRDGTNR